MIILHAEVRERFAVRQVYRPLVVTVIELFGAWVSGKVKASVLESG